jgi:hypothetical protein
VRRLLKDLREMARWEKAVLSAAVVLMAAWAAGKEMRARPGRIVVNVVPGDATVMIDNVKVGERSLTVERLPGMYTLSVTRDGYTRQDQNIEVRRDHAVALNVTLEPSPDTGFELTSDPPGALVWLDGVPVREASGQQARAPFRASRISPGHHLLEMRDGIRFKHWQLDFEVEAGTIRRIHATLVPLSAFESELLRRDPFRAAD